MKTPYVVRHKHPWLLRSTCIKFVSSSPKITFPNYNITIWVKMGCYTFFAWDLWCWISICGIFVKKKWKIRIFCESLKKFDDKKKFEKNANKKMKEKYLLLLVFGEKLKKEKNYWLLVGFWVLWNLCLWVCWWGNHVGDGLRRLVCSKWSNLSLTMVNLKKS